MLETYEGKVTVDISSLSDVTRHYLFKFKEELNKYIEEQAKKQRKTNYKNNDEIHRENMQRGR